MAFAYAALEVMRSPSLHPAVCSPLECHAGDDHQVVTSVSTTTCPRATLSSLLLHAALWDQPKGRARAAARQHGRAAAQKRAHADHRWAQRTRDAWMHPEAFPGMCWCAVVLENTSLPPPTTVAIEALKAAGEGGREDGGEEKREAEAPEVEVAEEVEMDEEGERATESMEWEYRVVEEDESVDESEWEVVEVVEVQVEVEDTHEVEAVTEVEVGIEGKDLGRESETSKENDGDSETSPRRSPWTTESLVDGATTASATTPGSDTDHADSTTTTTANNNINTTNNETARTTTVRRIKVSNLDAYRMRLGTQALAAGDALTAPAQAQSAWRMTATGLREAILEGTWAELVGPFYRWRHLSASLGWPKKKSPEGMGEQPLAPDSTRAADEPALASPDISGVHKDEAEAEEAEAEAEQRRAQEREQRRSLAQRRASLEKQQRALQRWRRSQDIHWTASPGIFTSLMRMLLPSLRNTKDALVWDRVRQLTLGLLEEDAWSKLLLVSLASALRNLVLVVLQAACIGDLTISQVRHLRDRETVHIASRLLVFLFLVPMCWDNVDVVRLSALGMILFHLHSLTVMALIRFESLQTGPRTRPGQYLFPMLLEAGVAVAAVWGVVYAQPAGSTASWSMLSFWRSWSWPWSWLLPMGPSVTVLRLSFLMVALDATHGVVAQGLTLRPLGGVRTCTWDAGRMLWERFFSFLTSSRRIGSRRGVGAEDTDADHDHDHDEILFPSPRMMQEEGREGAAAVAAAGVPAFGAGVTTGGGGGESSSATSEVFFWETFCRAVLLVLQASEWTTIWVQVVWSQALHGLPPGKLRLCIHGLATVIVAIAIFHLVAELHGTVVTVLNYLRALTNLTHTFPDVEGPELRGGEECCICQEGLTRAKRTPCGHLFHEDCLRLWVERSGHRVFTCPLCRVPLFKPVAGAHHRGRGPAPAPPAPPAPAPAPAPAPGAPVRPSQAPPSPGPPTVRTTPPPTPTGDGNAPALPAAVPDEVDEVLEEVERNFRRDHRILFWLESVLGFVLSFARTSMGLVFAAWFSILVSILYFIPNVRVQIVHVDRDQPVPPTATTATTATGVTIPTPTTHHNHTPGAGAAGAATTTMANPTATTSTPTHPTSTRVRERDVSPEESAADFVPPPPTPGEMDVEDQFRAARRVQGGLLRSQEWGVPERNLFGTASRARRFASRPISTLVALRRLASGSGSDVSGSRSVTASASRHHEDGSGWAPLPEGLREVTSSFPGGSRTPTRGRRDQISDRDRNHGGSGGGAGPSSRAHLSPVPEEHARELMVDGPREGQGEGGGGMVRRSSRHRTQAGMGMGVGVGPGDQTDPTGSRSKRRVGRASGLDRRPPPVVALHQLGEWDSTGGAWLDESEMRWTEGGRRDSDEGSVASPFYSRR